MPGRTLFIAESDCELHRAGKWLRVEHESRVVTRVDPASLDHILLFGEVALAPGAIALLLNAEVTVSFLDLRGRFRGHLTPADRNTPSLRQAQYACSEDPDYSLGLARAIVHSKVCAARQFIKRHHRNRNEADTSSQLKRLEEIALSLPDAQSLPQLRGLEGSAGAAYFEAFAQWVKRPPEFRKRTRRPPRDPVNALLSFGYSLLTAEVNAHVLAVGLDPQVGVLHATRAGRPALALDLIEEFRIPVVDRVVLECWNRGIISPDDFELRDDRVPWLKPPARACFLKRYERRMTEPFRHVNGFNTTYRRLLHGQARAIAHCLRHHELYRPLPHRL